MESRVRHSGKEEHDLCLCLWGWEDGGDNDVRESRTILLINDLRDYILNPRTYTALKYFCECAECNVDK
jgi:hypothetical protein